MPVESYDSGRHLSGLHALMNRHLEAIIPGWALSPAFIEGRLHDNPEQHVINPWVIARRTLCAVEGDAVIAAVHLLHYGTAPQVSDDYRDLAEIAWVLARPDRHAAGVSLVRAAREHARAWTARPVSVSFDIADLVDGVPDRWPHIAAVLRDAGFRPPAADVAFGRDAIRFGALPEAAPDQPPPGLTLRRRTGTDDLCLAAFDGVREIGACEARWDLTRGGLLPALGAWSSIVEFEVAPDRRGRGIGTWLLHCTCIALRRTGRTHVILMAADDDEGRRAGYLYDRFGWPIVASCEKVWDEAGVDGSAHP